MRDLTIKSKVDPAKGIRKADPVQLGAICELVSTAWLPSAMRLLLIFLPPLRQAREKHDELIGFEGDWVTNQMIIQFLTSHRKEARRAKDQGQGGTSRTNTGRRTSTKGKAPMFQRTTQRVTSPNGSDSSDEAGSGMSIRSSEDEDGLGEGTSSQVRRVAQIASGGRKTSSEDGDGSSQKEDGEDGEDGEEEEADNGSRSAKRRKVAQVRPE